MVGPNEPEKFLNQAASSSTFEYNLPNNFFTTAVEGRLPGLVSLTRKCPCVKFVLDYI